MRSLNKKQLFMVRACREPYSILLDFARRIKHLLFESLDFARDPEPVKGLVENSNDRSKNKEGFTLIEVLIAAVILAGGLVFVIEGMGRTQQILRIADNLVTASLTAEEKFIEAQLEMNKSQELSSVAGRGQEKFPGLEIAWDRQVRGYTDSTVEGTGKLNEVDVNVQWREGHRQNILKLISLILTHEKQL